MFYSKGCFAEAPPDAAFVQLQEQAFEKTQKYKEGKCILERTRLDDCFCSHPTLSDSECEDACMLP